jgi:hypothetical protein
VGLYATVKDIKSQIKLLSPHKINVEKVACYLLHAGFLLGLFFAPEDGGDILPRNIS